MPPDAVSSPSTTAPLVTLLCGPAGAGKTTLARRLEDDGAVRLSMDAATWADGWRGAPAPRERLVALHDGLKDKLVETVGAGRDVVVDFSLSTRGIRDEWRELAVGAGARVRLVVLRAPLPVLLERVARRGAEPGPDALPFTPDELTAYVTSFGWPGDDEPHELIDTSA